MLVNTLVLCYACKRTNFVGLRGRGHGPITLPYGLDWSEKRVSFLASTISPLVWSGLVRILGYVRLSFALQLYSSPDGLYLKLDVCWTLTIAESRSLDNCGFNKLTQNILKAELPHFLSVNQ